MKNTAEMTLGSLFDGIAGFPLAASRQGIKTVWVSEIEPDCIDIAKRHFPEYSFSDLQMNLYNTIYL